MIDSLFTNGVIAVREKNLLGDKLIRLAEGSYVDAARAVSESGFGSGAESRDGESLCRAEEEALDKFVREYAPDNLSKEYFLLPRDFHNAKAVIKAEILGEPADNMLAPEGLISPQILFDAVSSEDFSLLPEYLAEPLKAALLKRGEITGAEIGALFDGAEFKYLKKITRRSRALKKAVENKADRLNILTALRAPNEQIAEKYYLEGGSVKKERLSEIFAGGERAAKAFSGTPLADFYKLAYAAKEKSLPFTDAEKVAESAEVDYFAQNKYGLEGKQPFLYYVFRRKAEIADVRILLVCLNAGLPPQEIKRRLRSI